MSVLDLIIMIAATAPGLALTRTLPDYVALDINVMVNREIIRTNRSGSNAGLGWSTTGGKFLRSTGRPFQSRPSYWLSHIPCWAGPCLLSWTIAATALGLRSPRPRLRRLARRPGIAAGLAVFLALAIEAMECLRFLTTGGVGFGRVMGGWQVYSIYVLTSLTRLTGFSVAAWWLGLTSSGRWSAEVNAGGRLGRALGWCWIAMAVASELGVWCFALNY